MNVTAASSDLTYLVRLGVIPERLDWLAIANDLRHQKMSYTEQAALLGKEPSTHQEWRNGSQPRFADGLAFLILHAKHCGIVLTERRIRESIQETEKTR